MITKSEQLEALADHQMAADKIASIATELRGETRWEKVVPLIDEARQMFAIIMSTSAVISGKENVPREAHVQAFAALLDAAGSQKKT